MKKALITGASRGIGRALALALAKEYDIVVHYAGNDQKAKETLARIEQAGGKATLLKLDFTDLAAVQAAEIPDVDVLILNASIQYRIPWEQITVQDCHEQLGCNLISSLLMIQKAVPYMRKQGWGRIITVGSVQEAKPHPDMLIYAASKAAQTNMMHSLALQLAKDGITVNNLAPGVIYTDRNVEALSDPDYARQVAASIPAGFYGQPEDCVGAVELLCSEAGRYITGQSIYVDGGKSVQ